jgi:hypothetical protein
MDGQVVAVKKDCTDRFTQRRAARIPANDYLMSLFHEPLAKPGDLGRFSRPVSTVNSEKQSTHDNS